MRIHPLFSTAVLVFVRASHSEETGNKKEHNLHNFTLYNAVGALRGVTGQVDTRLPTLDQNHEAEIIQKQEQRSSRKLGATISTAAPSSADPCKAGTHACGNKADCVLVPASSRGYTCECKEGYKDSNGGNGPLSCVDIDECNELDQNLCPTGAICINTFPPEMYYCVCDSGYSGDGVSFCEDIDECALNIIDCTSSGAICINGPGTFACVCPEAGYTWTGNTCQLQPTVTPEPAVTPEPTVTPEPLATLSDPCNPDCDSSSSECMVNGNGEGVCECKPGFMRFSGKNSTIKLKQSNICHEIEYGCRSSSPSVCIFYGNFLTKIFSQVLLAPALT
mmetsp:Transcript_26378/g.37459  ORF Transcript_26378/g.37459 Transcript_26378/m.37459 type:complete len:335 (-) Transcript_26378:819-1823(-)